MRAEHIAAYAAMHGAGSVPADCVLTQDELDAGLAAYSLILRGGEVGVPDNTPTVDTSRMRAVQIDRVDITQTKSFKASARDC